jgi:3-oxoacyl-[acyl-carrier-protein] synthase-1
LSTAVSITGLGMVSGVGTCAAQSTASVRAGINRFREWPFSGLELPGPPIGSAVEGLGDAPWAKKAETLVPAALSEALFDARLYSERDVRDAYGRSRCAAWVTAPSEGRADDTTVVDTFTSAFASANLELPSELVLPCRNGHAAALLALAQAKAQLVEGDFDVALVVGADSLLESRVLGDLLSRDKLHGETEAAGLIPGEGAAVLVLERSGDAARLQRRVHAHVGAIASDIEPIRFDGEVPPDAAGLSRALLSVLEHPTTNVSAIQDVFTDLNGERGRFHEWGIASGRCLHRLELGWALHHPADCWGDLGAATGAFLLALAADGLRAGRLQGATALVSTMSESGERACAVLERS